MKLGTYHLLLEVLQLGRLIGRRGTPQTIYNSYIPFHQQSVKVLLDFHGDTDGFKGFMAWSLFEGLAF